MYRLQPRNGGVVMMRPSVYGLKNLNVWRKRKMTLFNIITWIIVGGVIAATLVMVVFWFALIFGKNRNLK
jgi:hypothetical protein